MSVFRFPHFLMLWLACGLEPNAASALNETDLCARALAQYGVEPQRCAQPIKANPISSHTALSEEILESHIFFPQGGASLNDDAQVQLAVLLSVLNATVMQSACLRLIGHSDTSGGANANKALALKRAETVAAALRDGLKNPSRIRSVVSAGEALPLSGLEDISIHNRRVEIQAKTCP